MNWKLFKKIFFFSSKLILLLVLADLPLVFLAWYLKAQGPWFLPALSSLLITALSLWITETKYSHTKTILSFLVFSIAFIWISIFLILINVSRRSQAELWFDMVRQGQAEGFFSYFAVLLIGVLTHGSALLYVYTGPLSALSAFFTTAGLIAAILFNFPIGWFFAGIGTFITLTFIIMKKTKNPFYFFKRIFFSLLISFFPVLLILLSGNLFFLVKNPSPISIVDLTPLVYRYFPDLPLLLEIPGYGTSINSGEFPPRLILSPLPLYQIQGPANTELYLATHIYRSFSDEGWVPFYVTPSEASFRLLQEKPSVLRENSLLLKLTLTSDFFQVLPLPTETKELYIPPGILKNLEKIETGGQISRPQGFTQFLMSGGLSFPEPIKKHSEFYVIYTKQNTFYYGIPAGYVVGKPEDFLEPLPDSQGIIRRLVQQWEHISDPLQVVQEMTSFLKKNYIYSEETKGGAVIQTIERFLFEEKKGYCLHFASALVALARERGIPARLVEGYRIYLDEKGAGEIRGTNAHAWVEVFIDGRWLRFDPTPAQGIQEEVATQDSI
ncbi:MAG TPA: transglutaminase domain-containing protein, partial [Termitinemataceae bacterium]|nr:transglutaminase domain-containing protein [Termitinemataceae bacterium]